MSTRDDSQQRHHRAVEPQKSEVAQTNNSYPVMYVAFGEDIFETWCANKASYPEELVNEKTLDNGLLYVCNQCFKYTGNAVQYACHQKHCATPIPGEVVFESSNYQIYEVNGEGPKSKEFCQCLSLFARVFLDVKTVSFDVEGFLFYLLVEAKPPSQRSQILGFFSKEKLSWDDNNLACILIFPPYQRRGLGRLLIAFSYEISKRNKKIGQPEKPLSDLGRKGYMSYWMESIAQCLQQIETQSISVAEISEETCIHPDDVIAALREMRVVRKDPALDGGFKIVRRKRKKA